MHAFKQASWLLPLFATLAAFAAPASAGVCYKIHNTRPSVQDKWVVVPDRKAHNTWMATFARLGGDGFTILLKKDGTLQMTSYMASIKHRYVIIFRYTETSEDWLYMDGGDFCEGLPRGEHVGVPVEVQVARIINM